MDFTVCRHASLHLGLAPPSTAPRRTFPVNHAGPSRGFHTGPFAGCQSLSEFLLGVKKHTPIHGAGIFTIIYLHEWLIFWVYVGYVGRYFSPMDPMGYNT